MALENSSILRKNILLGFGVSSVILAIGYFLSLRNSNPGIFFFIYVTIASILSIIIGLVTYVTNLKNTNLFNNLFYLTFAILNLIIAICCFLFTSSDAAIILWIEYSLNMGLGIVMLLNSFKNIKSV